MTCGGGALSKESRPPHGDFQEPQRTTWVTVRSHCRLYRALRVDFLKSIHLVQCLAHRKGSVIVSQDVKRFPPLSVSSTSKCLEKQHGIFDLSGYTKSFPSTDFDVHITSATFFRFCVSFWMKNPLHTGKMQAPQPPVQLLSCKEGKCIESETHMRRTSYDSRQKDRWSFRLYAHSTKEKRKAHCNKSPSSPWP